MFDAKNAGYYWVCHADSSHFLYGHLFDRTGRAHFSISKKMVSMYNRSVIEFLLWLIVIESPGIYIAGGDDTFAR